jgi:hypothetical protein
MELLGELRVVLPGAQVLLAFLFTVPFATHFNQVSRGGRIVFFVCLVLTSLATILLMAPSVYHRLRWEKGGKGDVIRVGHVMFLVGTAALGLGVVRGAAYARRASKDPRDRVKPMARQPRRRPVGSSPHAREAI